VRSQGSHQVQACVETCSDAASRDDAHAAQRHLCTPGNGLAAARVLPGIAALSSDRLPASIRCVVALWLWWRLTGLLDDVPDEGELLVLTGICAHLRIVVRVLAQVESSVVDDVSLLHHVGAHRHVAPSGILTDGLQAHVVVRVGCSGEALEHALLSKEQGGDVDGEDGAFFGGILLLKLNVLGEEVEGLGLVLEDIEDTLASGDDDDVEVLELVVGVLVVHVGLDSETLDGGHGRCGAHELTLESPAGWTSVSKAPIELARYGTCLAVMDGGQ
jgi:hypothetical protein